MVHFLPFHASWLNLVEIWFGILKSKCLQYDHFYSVDQLQTSISAFIQTWNRCFAHPFKWSYTEKAFTPGPSTVFVESSPSRLTRWTPSSLKVSFY